jgi:hypothetical protein
LHEKLLGAAAVVMFIGTIILIVNGKDYKKEVLSKSPQGKQQAK